MVKSQIGPYPAIGHGLVESRYIPWRLRTRSWVQDFHVCCGSDFPGGQLPIAPGETIYLGHGGICTSWQCITTDPIGWPWYPPEDVLQEGRWRAIWRGDPRRVNMADAEVLRAALGAHLAGRVLRYAPPLHMYRRPGLMDVLPLILRPGDVALVVGQ